MRNAGSDVPACRVRNGVAMTASWLSLIADSARQTIDTDAQVRRARSGQLAATIQRLSAKRAQKRHEQREFRAWLQITADPPW